MDGDMRAVVFDGPAPDTSRTRVASLPRPEPGPGQVAVDTRVAGVNFKDVMARRGDPGYVQRWPFVPGLEVAGTVRELGAGVDHVQVGDRVAGLTGSGGLAEVAVADAALLARIPDGVSDQQAAAVSGAWATAWLLLHDLGRVRAGDTVLVHSAAGAVAAAVAALARQAGVARLLGTVGQAARIDAARHAGFHAVVVRGPDASERLLAHLGGARVDLVLDPQGTDQLDLDLDVVAPGGRIVIFGNAGGGTLAALPPAGRLLAANVSIGGFSLASLATIAPDRVAGALRSVLEQLAAGQLTLDARVVGGLEQVADAQQALSEARNVGKQVVDVTR
jgi:NADPH2:quinone reductase